MVVVARALVVVAHALEVASASVVVTHSSVEPTGALVELAGSSMEVTGVTVEVTEPEDFKPTDHALGKHGLNLQILVADQSVIDLMEHHEESFIDAAMLMSVAILAVAHLHVTCVPLTDVTTELVEAGAAIELVQADQITIDQEELLEVAGDQSYVPLVIASVAYATTTTSVILVRKMAKAPVAGLEVA